MRLELLTESHLPAVTEASLDETVVRYTGFPWPPEEDFVSEFYARYQKGRAEGTKEVWVAVDDSGVLGIGMAVTVDRRTGEVELGYLVLPAAQGRGVATAMLHEMTTWALDTVKAQRIQLRIDPANIPSRRVAAKAGYQYEGTLRSRYIKAGRRGDDESWSLLPSDPRPSLA